MKPVPEKKLTAAAVLVPVVMHRDKTSLLFTRRSDGVRHHKGQVCFPGGARERGDTDLWHTALRETREEIGLSAERVACVGRLPALVTPTGFHVTPFVGCVSGSDGLKPNPSEIAEVFLAPLRHFLDPASVRYEKRDYFGVSHDVPFFSYAGRDIWGATGRMILHLVAALSSRSLQDFFLARLPAITNAPPA